ASLMDTNSDAGEVLELPLSDGLNTEGALHRLRAGDLLRFTLHHSLVGQHSNLLLETNHPPAADAAFSRSAWRRLGFTSAHPLDCFDACADLLICQAGCFDFRLLRPAVGGEEAATQAAVAVGSFVVEPQLPLSVPLEGLKVQTYLAKSLGPLSGWLPRLSVAAACGYNMIHFTPLQELGYSHSAYSLRDQLKPNPAFAADWPQISALIERLQTELGLLSMADLVFNHTANDSPWIAEHPECAYNLVNTPHLRPAYLVDRAIVHWSECIARGDYKADGLGDKVSTEEHLEKAKQKLRAILEGLNISDFYLCHVDNLVAEFSAYLVSGHCPTTGQLESLAPELLLLQPDPAYRRHGCRVRMDLAAKYHYLPVRHLPASVDRAAASLRQHLDYLNAERAKEIAVHISAAVDNAIAGARYRFVNPDGELLGRVTADTPMVWNYFLHQWPDIPLSSCERQVLDSPDRAVRVMAHNGWVMNDDPMRNFAEQPDCNIFLRRELIVWGDSVKLRYGRGPDDCPYLWQRMAEYTESTARVFHAVRLDNCHSTPLHVAQHMLDRARAVRPDLYVTGELFTGSERLDNIFISRLGISSCIREALSAWSPFELGRQVYKYGGPPVGDLQRERSHPICSAVSRALLFDATHDNPSPVEARSAHNLLPASALVAMAACATGSNRGYDELVPHHIHVVQETRLYQTVQQVEKEPAVTKGKRLLNELHAHLAAEGFEEQFVDQVTDSVVAVTRHNPASHQSVILIAHTAFSAPTADLRPHVPSLPISGSIGEVIFELTFSQTPAKFVRDPSVINGLTGCSIEARERLPLEKSQLVAFGDGRLHFKHLPPGAVVAIRVLLDKPSELACLALKKSLLSCKSPESGVSLEDAVSGLNAHHLSHLLFRCAAEEGGGIYNVPSFGDLVYCGLHRLGRLMREVNLRKDLGHPVCGNLRQGDWLPNYVLGRIERCGFAPKLAAWLSEYLKAMRQVPRYLVPSYFGSAVIRIHDALLARARSVLLPACPAASRLLFCLSLGSLQFVGDPPDSALPPLAPALADQLPRLSIAAGFPHFAAGLFRNWGRDTFISLRGLLLLTGRWDDARSVLLAYAGALRHGLIPNLCGGGGVGARYNCRDAVWYWLHCVCEFVAMAPSGASVLADPVLRLFPTDDSQPVFDCVQPLHQVMQEALQRHADGIDFVERNAGPQLDSHMRPEGFRVTAGLSWPFVVGGSRWNCGTWMDKMGGSERAGNRGVPATPRHGCAVELTGLCAAVVDRLAKFPRSAYPYEGVKHGGRLVSWADWAADLAKQFEPRFWLPESGHYRDRWLPDVDPADDPEGRQLRPNFLVAMVTAPFLFSAERARAALELTERRLLGPLGMRTLDPADPAYRGRYDNSDDSGDFSVAGGFSYHNGPEWLWPVGYYLRARLAFSEPPSGQVGHVQAVLARCQAAMEASDWHSLPELTNRDGEPCPHSCQAQAWSMATMFEAACDLRNLKL
ncbi:hypothetical protein BOX15_Mlig017645g1, partial [Macrostomum lignano]